MMMAGKVSSLLVFDMCVASPAELFHDEVGAQKFSGNVSLGKGHLDLPLAQGFGGLVELGSTRYI
jgi:hypothetical protein